MFLIGTQVAYVPRHAKGNINHEDVEFGFVTSDPGDEIVFVRYWSKSNPDDLRTKANSEGTPRHLLIEHDSKPQHVVHSILRQLQR